MFWYFDPYEFNKFLENTTELFSVLLTQVRICKLGQSEEKGTFNKYLKKSL